MRAIVDELYPSLTAVLRHEPNRRRFMQLMGASMGLAGLSGCRWPREEILPFADQPEGRVPGVPVQYATAMEVAGAVIGLLVTSYDGRPIKVEGNPRHPISCGKTLAWHQASVLDLYDPDRSQQPQHRPADSSLANSSLANSSLAEPIDWLQCRSMLEDHFALLREAQGAGLVIVAGPSCSPLDQYCQQQLQETLPQAKWFEIDPLSRNAEREGNRLAFGQPLMAHIDLDRAVRSCHSIAISSCAIANRSS